MKKTSIALVMIIIMIMGCSNSSETSNENEEVSEPTQSVNGETKSNDVQYVTGVDHNEYRWRTMSNADKMAENLEDLGDLLDTLHLRETDQWIMNFAIMLVNTEMVVEDMKSIKIVPKEFENSHEYMLKSMDELQKFLDEAPEAFYRLDLDNVFEYLKNSNVYMRHSIEEIQKMN